MCELVNKRFLRYIDIRFELKNEWHIWWNTEYLVKTERISLKQRIHMDMIKFIYQTLPEIKKETKLIKINIPFIQTRYISNDSL